MQASPEVEFKIGDKAVYPAQGVAEVISIDEKDIAGQRQRFYVLRILDTDRKIMVPVSNADAVGLRQVISEQEIREIFDILKERTIGFDTQTWNRRYRGFMDKIKTGSIYDVAEVLRDLYRLKANKQLSFGERRMLDTARSLIVKEIAIARKQTEEDVKTEIEDIVLERLHSMLEDVPGPQFRQRAPQAVPLRSYAAAHQDALDDLAQIRAVHGLLQEVVRAQAHGLDRGADIGIAGQDHHGRGVLLAGPLG